jgi:hypothetical protein
MSSAPKRGHGRPPKQTAEETRLRKLQYDQERYHRLKSKPLVESDPNEPTIAPPLAFTGPTAIPTVESGKNEPTIALLPAFIGPITIPAGPSGSTIPIGDSIPPISDNESLPDFQFEDDDVPSASASSSDHGGHTVDGSGGGHIDENIYRVLDGDQEGGHTVDSSGGGHIDEDIYGVLDGD